ncbi:MAG TPA: MarP family serine protease [Gaiellaceae bacterium]|nr:MarP family serine protease [Gaiellaceae bacterium]
MTRVDWIAFLFVAVTAFIGFRKGLVASALSVAGVVIGAIVGARLAPHLLAGGARSPYTPLVGLAGAAAGAVLLETLGTVTGTLFRNRMRFAAIQTVDTAGGLVLGAIAGFAVVWVVGAVALHFPGQDDLRRGAQRSLVLQRLNELVPPRTLMSALDRVDPFPTITGPDAPVDPPDPQVVDRAGVRQAAPSVLRVLGTACGLGVSGSGWIAADELIVTAAHVVAGQSDTMVEPAGGVPRLHAQTVHFDKRNDVAVLRVPGLDAAPLAVADPEPGTSVAVLGFPESGPFSITAGRVGRTLVVLARDAYGDGPVARTITSLRARVRHGHSGAPAVDAQGRVQSTIFAARPGGEVGYGVPATIVRRALAQARGPVSTGECAA